MCVFLYRIWLFWVYTDDKLIYSVEQLHSVFGNSPGVIWNFVDVPSETEQLTVIVRAAYPQVRQKKIDFYAGDTGRHVHLFRQFH